MSVIQRYFLFNQMAGPLFRELACSIAEQAPQGAVLFTGHPDTVSLGPAIGKLSINTMPVYDRRNKMKRLLSWVKFTLLSIAAMARMQRSDVAIIVSNPPTIGPIAWLARLFGRRYFVLVYDLHPDTLINMGSLSENGVFAKIWRWVNRRVWNASEGVITIGARMADQLASQYSPERTYLGRVEVIPVWVDTHKIRPIARADNNFARSLGVMDKTVVLYSGNMGFSHDIDSILTAAKILAHRNDIAFIMIGEGAKWQDAYDFKQTHKLSNLEVLPFQPERVLPYSLGMADISIVSLDTGTEGLMIPSKTFYYMAAGSAIIAICRSDSELSDTIDAAQSGLRIEPGRPEQLAEEIRALADDRQRLTSIKSNARAYCVSHHERTECTARFLDLVVK